MKTETVPLCFVGSLLVLLSIMLSVLRFRGLGWFNELGSWI